jgi:hypothetical protein
MTHHYDSSLKDRRAGQAEQIKEIVYQALREQSSFKKNGHSWREWIQKFVTPQNIILIFVLVFNAGGWWREQRADQAAIRERTTMLQEQHDLIVAKMQDIEGRLKLQGDLSISQGEQLKVAAGAAEAARRQVALVSQAQKGTITRDEFNAAIRQQLVPRLDRIEKTLP